MIVTPRQLERQSEFYHQLGTLIEAGLSLVQSLESFNRSKRSRVFRQPVTQLLDALEGGATFAEAASGIRGWLPAFDLALLDSGERSGRLDVCFRVLADFYKQRAQAAREVINQLIYPLLLLHAGVLLAPFPDLFLTGDVAVYLSRVGAVLIPLYLVIGGLAYLAQGRHGRVIQSLLERLFGMVPLLGAGRKSLALSRFCLALEALLAAGTNMSKAWSLAAAASGSPRIQREVEPYSALMEGGRTPGELLEDSRWFPDAFVSLYATGEKGGRLDENLGRMRTHYQDEGFNKLRQFASWLPKLIYFGILIYFAYKILSFYSGYYNSVLDSTDF